jgi:GxxExxY protein
MDFNDGSYEVIGCAMRVHNVLGPGLREKPYENALVFDLLQNGLRVDPQKAYPIRYLGQIVGDCIPDITVCGKILVDVKSIDVIGANEIGQMLNYLRISKMEIGLVINFKNAKLEWERVVRSQLE